MSTRRGRPRYPDILTPRQFEVLELVREGLSNGEIGRRLGISPDGAKFHVSEIITKLGVTSRGEAAGTGAVPRERARPSARLRLGRLEVGGWRLERAGGGERFASRARCRPARAHRRGRMISVTATTRGRAA